jgi:hypothetical protein
MNLAQSFQVTATVITEVCITCGCVFGLPQDMQMHLKKSHAKFYCPSGHEMYYPGESDRDRAERLAKELADEKERRMREETLKVKEMERARRAEKELSLHKKRVANGVCPCCKRSFVNLQRHMKTKHPAEVAAANAEH